jgi:hypothetical protein
VPGAYNRQQRIDDSEDHSEEAAMTRDARQTRPLMMLLAFFMLVAAAYSIYSTIQMRAARVERQEQLDQLKVRIEELTKDSDGSTAKMDALTAEIRRTQAQEQAQP